MAEHCWKWGDDNGDSEALWSPNWPVTQSKASQSGGDRQQNNTKCAGVKE